MLSKDAIFAGMNKGLKVSTFLIALAGILTCSCGKITPELYDGPFDSVTIYYAEAYNNLSSSLLGLTRRAEADSLLCSDIQDLCRGEIPDKTSKRALVAFCHGTSGNARDYTTPNSPVLIRLYKENGTPVLDTVYVYQESTVTASAENLHNVLSQIRSKYVSDHYGLIYSSHGSGWLPCNFYTPNNPAPAPKSVGAQFDRSSSYTYETDILDFAKAIPMKLDYIIFDACLMGGIEVAYELRNVCDRLVFSPTEIFTEGMYYRNLAGRLLKEKPDLENVCRDYMEHYESGATISLVDCSKLGNLAGCTKKLLDKYGDGVWKINRNSVQKYYTGSHEWFFDMRDIIAKAGAPESELVELDRAIDGCIIFKDYTPEFGKGTQYYIRIDRYSGLSMYLPMTKYPQLNTYYGKLDWNKAVGLVK